MIGGGIDNHSNILSGLVSNSTWAKLLVSFAPESTEPFRNFGAPLSLLFPAASTRFCLTTTALSSFSFTPLPPPRSSFPSPVASPPSTFLAGDRDCVRSFPCPTPTFLVSLTANPTSTGFPSHKPSYGLSLQARVQAMILADRTVSFLPCPTPTVPPLPASRFLAVQHVGTVQIPSRSHP